MRCSKCKCSCGAQNTVCVGMGPLSGGMRAKQVTEVEGASVCVCKRKNGMWSRKSDIQSGATRADNRQIDEWRDFLRVHAPLKDGCNGAYRDAFPEFRLPE
jgi:hypothetical protein